VFIIAIIFMVVLTCFLVSSVETCLEQALGGGLVDLRSWRAGVRLFAIDHFAAFPLSSLPQRVCGE